LLFLGLLAAERDPGINNQDALLGIVRKLHAITHARRPPPIHVVPPIPPFHLLLFNGISDLLISEEPAIVEIQENLASPRFFNWGQTYSFVPGKTLVIRTKEGVCRVVKWAADNGRKVRVAGFRHSWS
jgi:hypothetical protein